jgi:hypothetical protein
MRLREGGRSTETEDARRVGLEAPVRPASAPPWGGRLPEEWGVYPPSSSDVQALLLGAGERPVGDLATAVKIAPAHEVVGQAEIAPLIVGEGYGLVGCSGCADALSHVPARPNEETSDRSRVDIGAGAARAARSSATSGVLGRGAGTAAKLLHGQRQAGAD